MKSGIDRQSAPNAQLDASRTDEELVVRLAHGHQEGLGALYSRYAALIFHLAAHSLDRGVAEEVVQEVFLTVWRSAHAFDPAQGAFRPWLMRQAHWRILNALRRRKRRPRERTGDSADQDEPIPEPAGRAPGPEERAWQNEHGQLVRSALQALPPKQRQAVALAFLEGLSHEQVAQALDVPLGTAKTRIRSGLTSLRLRLAPMAASLPGVGLAIPGLPADRSYQAWVRHADRWTSLGTFTPDADGGARLVAEDAALAAPPDVVEITVEPSADSQSPTAPVVLLWPG